MLWLPLLIASASRVARVPSVPAARVASPRAMAAHMSSAAPPTHEADVMVVGAGPAGTILVRARPAREDTLLAHPRAR